MIRLLLLMAIAGAIFAAPIVGIIASHLMS